MDPAIRRFSFRSFTTPTVTTSTHLTTKWFVLTVQASTVDLRAPAANTELIPTSDRNNKTSALEIRGNSTEYVFGAKITSGE
jgi:hypothetical protein